MPAPATPELAAGRRAGPGRALLLIGQSPFDPASGAARSMQTMARWLARAGWSVRALSTNASESPSLASGLSLDALAAQGLIASSDDAGVLHARAHGVDWHWLPTTRQRDWEREVGPAYDACLARLLRDDPPDVVLTFGDDPGDRRRRRQCRLAGTRVVFALHNLAFAGRALPDVDRLLAPSEFLAQAYLAAGQPERGGRAAHAEQTVRAVPPAQRAQPAQMMLPRQAASPLRIDVLPMPIEADDLLSDDHEPLCVVFANPEPLKGMMLVARLAERLALHRPDIPLLIAGGRGGAQEFLAQVARLGVSPEAAPNVLLAPDGLPPRELFRLARMALMPSIVIESGGRVAAEAQCVGAVPIVSDRGALPETVGAGGIVLPLPGALLRSPLQPVSVDDAAPWLAAIESLVDSHDEFARWQALALANSRRFTADLGVPALDRWMRGVCGLV